MIEPVDQVGVIGRGNTHTQRVVVVIGICRKRLSSTAEPNVNLNVRASYPMTRLRVFLPSRTTTTFSIRAEQPASL